MKKHLPTLILILIFLTGLSLLLYPTVSDYWNSRHQSQAIASYVDAVNHLDEDTFEQMKEDARLYNEELAGHEMNLQVPEAERPRYESLLDVNGTGIMGYIEIPKLKCTLPIYHGTDEGTLQIAVGHIEGTSLPVGGESTHCVLSGHRGLPSAKLFTDLDEMEEGDIFQIRVLDETLTYEVDQILIVEPQETDALRIELGEDLCTLVTCTPYGINSHRLLVRGHRTSNPDDAASMRVTSDAVLVDSVLVASVLAVPIFMFLLAVVLATSRRKGR